MDQKEYRVEVLILTSSYRVKGSIAHFTDIRLTDFLLESKDFIAVLDAEVEDPSGALLFKTPFLNVNRANIEIMLPIEKR